jgi:hypothetical protein
VSIAGSLTVQRSGLGATFFGLPGGDPERVVRQAGHRRMEEDPGATAKWVEDFLSANRSSK